MAIILDTQTLGKRQDKIEQELTATTIVKYQTLLQREFSVGGLQDPGYGIGYKFTAQSGLFVQIMHVNNNHSHTTCY